MKTNNYKEYRDIRNALNTLRSVPTTKNEMLVTLSASTLVSAAAKLTYLNKRFAYGVVKPTISRLVTHFLKTGEKPFDAMYYDLEKKCIYINCLGMQFSYHNISETEEILQFANSEENQFIVFEEIYKQPKSLSLYRLATECLDNNISDPAYIRSRFDELDWDYPELLERHIGDNSSPEKEKMCITTILGTKYKISNAKEKCDSDTANQ